MTETQEPAAGIAVLDDQEAAVPENAIAASWRRRLWGSPVVGVGLALIALLVLFSLLAPSKFASLSNLRNLFADASVMLIVAMPTSFVLISGKIDLSLGSVIAFSEVLAVKAMIAAGGGGLGTCLVGLLAAVAGAAAWGVVNGLLVARAGVPPFIVTLATMGAALGAALLISGGNDIAQVPAGLVDVIGIGTLAGIPVLTLIAAAVIAVTAWTLVATRFGRYCYAIGSDSVASERAGIDVSRHVIKVYTLAGVAYGVGAYLNLARFSTTTIGGHASDALNAIAGVALGGVSIFGGVGSPIGSAIGIFIPAVLQNGLVIINLPPYWQQIAIGVALVAAVYADQWRRRSQRR